MEKISLKIGDKVRVKKGLTEEQILREYLLCDPIDDNTKKEILDFYLDVEKVHVLTGVGNDCSTEGFGYVLIDYLLEPVIEKKITKEGLINVFEALFKGIKENNDKEATETELFKFLENQKQWMDNPENFGLFITNKFEDIVEVLVEKSFDYADDTMKGIYNHYSIYESMVRRLVETEEGFVCCADKSRFILKSYFKYCKEGKLPEYNTENYWVPNKGTNDSWIGLVRGITELIQGGNPTSYLIRMREIIES